MNINDGGELISVEDLPNEALSLLKETDFFEDFMEDLEEWELEDMDINIRMIPYPKHLPIAFGGLEYGRNTTSSVSETYNLKESDTLKHFATSVTFYEKINPHEKAYAVFVYQDYDYGETEYRLIEIG